MPLSRLSLARRSVVTLTIAALLFVPARVDGQYLDPGAASIIIQVVVAGVVAVAATLKLYWRRIAGLFSRRGQETKPEER